MKTFRRSRRNKRSPWVLFLGVFLILAIEFTWNPLKNIFLGVTSPILEQGQKQTHEAGLFFQRLLTSERTLQEEIKTLQEEVYNLQFQIQETDLLRKENKDLRDLLKYQKNGQLQEGVVAQVIQKPSSLKTDQIVVLTEISQSVKVGDAVYFGPYQLGKVSQVTQKVVTVDLVSKNEVVRGLLDGEGIDLQSQGSMLFLSQIPKSTEVEVGDVITLEQYPDEPFVEITDIEVDEIDPFKTLFVKLPVAFSDISYVVIQ